MNSYINSASIALDGIHHYQQLILENLNEKDKVKAICSDLGRFLQDHQAYYNTRSLADCQVRLQKIALIDDLEDKKIVKLFTALYTLEESVAKAPYSSTPNPIHPSQYQALSVVSQQMDTISTIRKNLKVLKENTQDIVNSRLLNNETAGKYGQYFEKRFNSILQNILLHAVKKLDQRGVKGPDMTLWSALVLGSLARGEGHPYSDIDMVFLIDPSLEQNAEARKYFEALMQEMADLVHQVGEEGEGFKLCGGNLTPPYMTYSFRFADKSNSSRTQEGGMGSFIATPHRLAILSYQSAINYVPMKGTAKMQLAPISNNENLIAPSLLDAKPIFGNETLYNEFCELRKKLGSVKASDLFDGSHYSNLPWKESNTAEDLFYKSILGMSIQNRGTADYERNKVNIKKDFMRPIQMGISVLAAKMGLEERSTADRLDALANLGFFKKPLAELIKETYLSLYKMRIEESAIFKGENDDVAFSEKAILEASEKHTSLFKEFCKLTEAEFDLLLSKKEGKESMADLIQNGQLQDAYREEMTNLFKFTTQNRVHERETFESHKDVCIKTIEAIKKYQEAL